jgi:CRP-like cAMP-binding protein
MLAVSVLHTHIRNNLLKALVNKDYQHLCSDLESVQLTLGDVIYKAGEEIHYVYFPETAVVSLLALTEDGSTTEVGIIGREGMVGLNIFLLGESTHDEAMVQVAGSAMRMKASKLREELRLGNSLHILLLRYTRAFLALITQSVICSQKHSVEQRLARWLLIMLDYVETNKLKLTHELISGMLGARRAGVTTAIGSMRDAGYIKTSRGIIDVVNRKGLEPIACECYEVIRAEFNLLYNSQTAK